MKYCKNCDIKYDEPIEKCLLCENHLLDDNTTHTHEHYPTYKKEKRTNEIARRITSLVTIVSIIVVLFIDYSISKKLSWSVIVVASNIYLQFLFMIIFSKIRTSIKIFNLTILTTILVVVIGIIINDYHWAVDIFLPFALIANTISIMIIILSRPKKWRDYISFLITSIFLNLAIIIFNLVNLTNTTWAVTTSFIFGLITLIGFIIFTPKDLKEEIKRRFHI